MPYDMGTRKQVFVDWELIEPGYGVAWGGSKPSSWEMPYGVQIAVHAPRIEPQPMVGCEHPWESMINVYCTLFQDEGLYRLYYEPHYMAQGDEASDLKAMLAYAESSDGAHWVKPRIGTVSFQGSTDNNLVYALDVALGRGAHGGTVFKDPSAPADARYKFIHMGAEGGQCYVYGAISPDGLHWTALEQPLIRDYMSDTQTVVRFDEAKGRYVGYFRGWRGLEHGWHGRRCIAYAETEDFAHWPTPQLLVAPDVHDQPSADIYTNAYTPWPGAPDYHLMFPAFYQRAQDVTEVHLMTSRDGLHWQRPSRHPIIAGGNPGAYWEGGVYAGCGLVEVEPGTWSLPIGPQWRTHNQTLFRADPSIPPPHRGILLRAVWRQDGFTSLEAQTEGACTTMPFTFSGQRLQVNAWTRFGGELRIELATASGETVTGHTFADCDPISGDALQHTVTWQSNADLSVWIGQPMRLRLQLRRARLHALQFV
jgi:hypothetical protein